MKTNKTIYIILLLVAVGILYFALNFNQGSKITISEYQPTQDNTNYNFKYTLKFANVKEAAEVLKDTVANNGFTKYPNYPNLMPIPLTKPVNISYNIETNTLYFQTDEVNYKTILNAGIKNIDVFQPQVYLETITVIMSPDQLGKFKFTNDKATNTDWMKTDKSFDTSQYVTNWPQNVLFTKNVLAKNYKEYEVTDNNKNYNMHFKVWPEVTKNNEVTLKMSHYTGIVSEKVNTSKIDQMIFSDVKTHETIIFKAQTKDDNSVVTFVTPYVINSQDDYANIVNKHTQTKAAPTTNSEAVDSTDD